MKIAGYDFHYVCDIELLRETDGTVRRFMPQDRYRNARNLSLNTYGAGPFCKFKIRNGSPTCGVYVLTVDDKVRYVGECANLTARFNAGYGNISPKNCFNGGQETNCRLNSLIYAEAQAESRLSLWFFHTPITNQLRPRCAPH